MNSLTNSIIYFVLLCVLPVIVAAQDDKPDIHPIESAQAKCLKTHHGTMPRAKCYSDAALAWEKDVTKTYATLLQTVKADDKTSLEASQTAWEKYRDAEFDFIGHIYGDKKGTGYISVRIIKRLSIVRSRALELEDWLEYLK